MLTRLPIRHLVVLSGLLGVACAGLIAGSAFVEAGRLTGAMRRMQTISDALRRHADADSRMDAMRTDILQAIQIASGLGRGEQAAVLDDVDTGGAAIRLRLDRNLLADLPPAVLRDYGAVVDQLDDFVGAATEATRQALRDPAAGMAAYDRFRQNFDRLQTAMDAARAGLDQASAAAMAESRRLAPRVEARILLTAILGMLGTGLFFAAGIRTMFRMLTDIARSMERLAAGETGIAIPGLGREDTIGAMARAVAVFRDGMVRADALAAELSAESSRYRHLFERTPVALHSIDLDGRLLAVSDRWLDMLGYERDEVIGRRSTDLLTPESATWARQVGIPEFIRSGVAVEYAYQFVKKNGETVDILLSAVMEHDVQGRPLHSLAVLVDQSRQKHAEAARQASEADAALAHARLRDAIESMNDGFLLWDREDRLVMGNLTPFHAWIPEDAQPSLGMSFEAWVRLMIAEFVDAVGCEEAFVAKVMQRQREWASAEYRMRNGRWVQASRRPTGEGGRVSIYRDITDTKRHEQDLMAARAEAEAANRAKTAFLAQMSHELRTPLNAVIGFTELLLLDRNLNDGQREYCGYVLTGGQRLLMLVEDVLDFAGVNAGQFSLVIAPVVLAPALQEVRRLLAASAASQQVTLAVERTGAAVLADPRRLHQVLVNLVSNAIKYNRPGGNVRLSAAVGEAGRVRITVADTGHGIDPDQQPRLFIPFERLSMKHTAIPGTGLGLSLVKQLVEAMGGAVGCVSTPGQGSAFWIELPAAAVPGGAAREALLPAIGRVD